MKETTLTVRVDDRDRERLKFLCDHSEMNQSQVIRLLLKREAEALGFTIETPIARAIREGERALIARAKDPLGLADRKPTKPKK